MVVLSFSLIRDRECTWALEHCGRADAAYGMTQRVKPVVLFGSPVERFASDLGRFVKASPYR